MNGDCPGDRVCDKFICTQPPVTGNIFNSMFSHYSQLGTNTNFKCKIIGFEKFNVLKVIKKFTWDIFLIEQKIWFMVGFLKYKQDCITIVLNISFSFVQSKTNVVDTSYAGRPLWFMQAQQNKLCFAHQMLWAVSQYGFKLETTHLFRGYEYPISKPIN